MRAPSMLSSAQGCVTSRAERASCSDGSRPGAQEIVGGGSVCLWAGSATGGWTRPASKLSFTCMSFGQLCLLLRAQRRLHMLPA